MADRRLGEIKKTQRGFEIIEFKDYYGAPCSLQQSSLADASSIWLGCNENEKPHHVTGETGSPRMHLSHSQVRALQRHLRQWCKYGTFDLKAKS